MSCHRSEQHQEPDANAGRADADFALAPCGT